MKISENLNKWLLNGERGISSNAIVSHLTGINFLSCRWASDHPRDPSDFRRCLELLKAVPEFKLYLYGMATRSNIWAEMIKSWDELEQLFYDECDTGKCPKLYERMQEIQKKYWNHSGTDI